MNDASFVLTSGGLTGKWMLTFQVLNDKSDLRSRGSDWLQLCNQVERCRVEIVEHTWLMVGKGIETERERRTNKFNILLRKGLVAKRPIAASVMPVDTCTKQPFVAIWFSLFKQWKGKIKDKGREWEETVWTGRWLTVTDSDWISYCAHTNAAKEMH